MSAGVCHVDMDERPRGLCLGVCHQLIELVVVISEEKKLVFFANVCFICELKVDDLWI